MSRASDIYRETVSGLPPDEKLRLAALILRDLAAEGEKKGGRVSVVGLINSFPPGRGLKNSADAADYLRAE